MSNFKRQQIRSRPYLNGAKGQSCVICDADDGTIVSAHYSGMGAHKLGKGAGIKSMDLAVADLCHSCHTEMDGYANGRDEEAALVFCFAIFATQQRRFEQGLLTIKGAK